MAAEPPLSSPLSSDIAHYVVGSGGISAGPGRTGQQALAALVSAIARVQRTPRLPAAATTSAGLTRAAATPAMMIVTLWPRLSDPFAMPNAWLRRAGGVAWTNDA